MLKIDVAINIFLLMLQCCELLRAQTKLKFKLASCCSRVLLASGRSKPQYKSTFFSIGKLFVANIILVR